MNKLVIFAGSSDDLSVFCDFTGGIFLKYIIDHSADTGFEYRSKVSSRLIRIRDNPNRGYTEFMVIKKLVHRVRTR